MQKLIRITDQYYFDKKEILNEYLEDDWKVINIVTTSSSQTHITYFHTIVLLEKNESK